MDSCPFLSIGPMAQRGVQTQKRLTMFLGNRLNSIVKSSKHLAWYLWQADPPLPKLLTTLNTLIFQPPTLPIASEQMAFCPAFFLCIHFKASLKHSFLCFPRRGPRHPLKSSHCLCTAFPDALGHFSCSQNTLHNSEPITWPCIKVSPPCPRPGQKYRLRGLGIRSPWHGAHHTVGWQWVQAEWPRADFWCP